MTSTPATRGWGFALYRQERGAGRRIRQHHRTREAAMSELVELHAALVRLPSVNPCGREPAGPHESESRMSRFVHDWLSGHGIDCRLQEVLPGRDNVIARVEGREEPPIVFEAHLDTVAAEGMTVPPFEALIEDGRLYGRGACDVKGGLAAMMMALARVAQGAPPPRTVVL
ncbi:MAG TPA: M20 family peptidase, partial [Thioalkalivibrio sp.]|nr:M20 family peptidase [Thioalkalivibrio sp.]